MIEQSTMMQHRRSTKIKLTADTLHQINFLACYCLQNGSRTKIQLEKITRQLNRPRGNALQPQKTKSLIWSSEGVHDRERFCCYAKPLLQNKSLTGSFVNTNHPQPQHAKRRKRTSQQWGARRHNV
jgi:hypothetical protein